VKPSDEERELVRLLAEQHSPLTSLVAELRNRGPDATELASLASRLTLQGVDVASRVPSLQTSTAWKKWTVAASGAASVVIVWLAVRAPARSPTVPVDDGGRSLSAHATTKAESLTTARSASGATPARGPVRGLQPDATTAAAAAPAAPEQRTLVPSVSPLGTSPFVAGERAAPPSAGAETAANADAPVPRPKSIGSSSQPGVTNDFDGKGEASAAPSEIELLRDARLALRQSPERALELSERHAQLYSQGRLSQERELIAISALISLGRRTAALSRGARFERTFPSSPYRKQVGELLR
jgi:hypothetical protein